jgi:signal transduction histidine kinase
MAAMADAQSWRATRLELGRGAATAHVLRGLAYVALFALLDWASFAFAYSGAGLTPWNPQAGLGLALMLRYGLGNWPWVAAATVAAEVLVHGQGSAPILFGLAAISTAAYTAAAAVLTARGKIAWHAPSVRDAVVFTIVGATTTAVVGVLQAALFIAAGDIAPGEFAPAALRSGVGELSGVLVFAPLLLHFAATGWVPARTLRGGLRRETALQGAALALALWLVFGLESTDEFKFFFLLVVPIGWIAVRRGFVGACVAALGAQLGTFLLALHRGFDSYTATEFQVLSLALIAAALIVGAVADERSRAAEALAEHRLRLAHAARVSAAGEMVSALAHELSQPLTAMATYLATCRRIATDATADPAELGAPIEAAAAQAERARAVIQRLRGFLRRGEVNLAAIDAQAALRDAVALIRPEATLNKVEIELAFDAGPIQVLADTVQFQQVALNLLRNAIEAIDASHAAVRRIVVALQRDGTFAAISVSDTGSGLPAAKEGRLFQPFATTKPEGMGLGLAISRSLVEAHGGTLAGAGAPGGGARFVIRLPLAATDAG